MKKIDHGRNDRSNEEVSESNRKRSKTAAASSLGRAYSYARCVLDRQALRNRQTRPLLSMTYIFPDEQCSMYLTYGIAMLDTKQ